MTKKKCCQVDSHLQCKSTAALDNQIEEDLCQQDKPLAELLEEEEKEQDAQE